ncbi:MULTISPECIES: DUF6148 family protein [Pontibacillus]|uniref:DUF6148 family protein n=1 Tax=Pontibacillus chungwhensis TaxID=265426 RepID=A0ABY8V4G5_9BACI|nr:MULTISPECIES: DUF6148 family protein [Pontibacillus]MCD5324766.1 DUF6148 family protein [Pontibacillus sp. HN14]WIF98726.1 DUF6148 family protein [Pontibacillus chungwhensis]
MPGITLEEAKRKLKIWLDAEDKVATGQSYRIGNRQIQRADLPEIRKQINYWRKEIGRLEGGRRRVRRAVPRDW